MFKVLSFLVTYSKKSVPFSKSYKLNLIHYLIYNETQLSVKVM